MLQHNTSPAGKQNHRALLLALFLALVLLISLTWIFLSARPSGESWRAEIYQDGDLLYSIPLGDLSALTALPSPEKTAVPMRLNSPRMVSGFALPPVRTSSA